MRQVRILLKRSPEREGGGFKRRTVSAPVSAALSAIRTPTEENDPVLENFAPGSATAFWADCGDNKTAGMFELPARAKRGVVMGCVVITMAAWRNPGSLHAT